MTNNTTDNTLYICGNCGYESRESNYCVDCNQTMTEYKEIDVESDSDSPYIIKFIYNEHIQTNISYIQGRFRMRYIDDIDDDFNDAVRMKWSVVIHEKVTDSWYYITFDTDNHYSWEFMHEHEEAVGKYFVDGMTSEDIYLPILGDDKLELTVEAVKPSDIDSAYVPKKFNLLSFIRIPYDLFINKDYQITVLGVTEASDIDSSIDTAQEQRLRSWINGEVERGININASTNINDVYATVWWKHDYTIAETVSYKNIVNYKIVLSDSGEDNKVLSGVRNVREKFIVSLKDIERVYESGREAIFKYRFKIPEEYIMYYLGNTNKTQTTLKVTVVARRQVLRLSSRSEGYDFNVKYRRDIEICELCVKENDVSHYGENSCFNYDAVDDHTRNYATLNLEFKLKRSGSLIKTWGDLQTVSGTDLRVVVFRYSSLLASRKDIFKRLTNMCRSGEIFNIGVNNSPDDIREAIVEGYGLTADNCAIDLYNPNRNNEEDKFGIGLGEDGLFSVSYNQEYMGDNDPRTDLGNNSSYYMVFYVVVKDGGIVYKSERSCNIHVLRRPIIRNFYIESSRFGKKRCDYSKGFNMDIYDGSGGDVSLTWGVDRVTLRQWLGLDISKDNKSFGELIKEFFQVTWSNILRNYERTKNILTPVRFDLDMIIKTDFKFVLTGGQEVSMEIGGVPNNHCIEYKPSTVKIGLEYCAPMQDTSDHDYNEPYFDIMVDNCDTDFIDWLLGLDHQHHYTTNMYRFTDPVHSYPGDNHLLDRAKEIIKTSILSRCVRFAVVPEEGLYNNESYVYGSDPYNKRASTDADTTTYSSSVYTRDLSNILIDYGDGYTVVGNAYNQFENTGERYDDYMGNVNNVYSAVFKGYRSEDGVKSYVALLDIALANTSPDDIYNMIRVMLDKSYLTFRLSQANLCKNIGGSPIPVVWQCPKCGELFAVVDNDAAGSDRDKLYILSTEDSNGITASRENHNVKIGSNYYFYKSAGDYRQYYGGDDERKFKNFNSLRSVRKEFKCPNSECDYKPCDHQVNIFPKITKYIRSKVFGNISDDSVGGLPKIGEFDLYDYNSRIDNMIAEVISANKNRSNAIWQIILTIIAYTFKAGSRYDSTQTLSEKLSSEYTSIADFNNKTGITAMRNGIKEYNNNMRDYYACTCSECGHRIFMDILYHDGSKMVICPYCKKKNVRVSDIDRVNLYEVSNNRDIPIMGHYSPTGDITLISPAHARYSYDIDSYSKGYIADVAFKYDARDTYGKVDGFRVTFIQSNPVDDCTYSYNLDRSKNELSFTNGTNSTNNIRSYIDGTEVKGFDGESISKVISIFIIVEKDDNGNYINKQYKIVENNNGIYNSDTDDSTSNSVSISDLTISEDCGCIYVQFKADFSKRTDEGGVNTEDEIVEYLDIDIRAFYLSRYYKNIRVNESVSTDNILSNYVSKNKLIYGSYRVYSYDTTGYDYGIIIDKAWQSGFCAIIKKKEIIKLIYPDPRSTNIYYNIPGLAESDHGWEGCDNPPIGEYHWYGNNMRILASINDYDRIIGESYDNSEYKIEDIRLISETEITKYIRNLVNEGNLVYNGNLQLYPSEEIVYHVSNPLNYEYQEDYEGNIGGFIESDYSNPSLKKIVADHSILPGYVNVIHITGNVIDNNSSDYNVMFTVLYKSFNTDHIADIYFKDNNSGDTDSEHRLMYMNSVDELTEIEGRDGEHIENIASSIFNMRQKSYDTYDGTGYFCMVLYASAVADNENKFNISLYITPGYNKSETARSSNSPQDTLGSFTSCDEFADGTILIDEENILVDSSDVTHISGEIYNFTRNTDSNFNDYNNSGLSNNLYNDICMGTGENISNINNYSFKEGSKKHYISGTTNSLFRIEDMYNLDIKEYDVSYEKFTGSDEYLNDNLTLGHTHGEDTNRFKLDKSFSKYNRYGSEIIDTREHPNNRPNPREPNSATQTIFKYKVMKEKYARTNDSDDIVQVEGFGRTEDEQSNVKYNIGMNIRIIPLCASSGTDIKVATYTEQRRRKTITHRLDYISKYGYKVGYNIDISVIPNPADISSKVLVCSIPFTYNGMYNMSVAGDPVISSDNCDMVRFLHNHNYGMIDTDILIEGLYVDCNNYIDYDYYELVVDVTYRTDYREVQPTGLTQEIVKVAKVINKYANYDKDSHSYAEGVTSRLYSSMREEPTDRMYKPISTNIDRMSINDIYNIGLYDNYAYNPSGPVDITSDHHTSKSREYCKIDENDSFDYLDLRNIWLALDYKANPPETHYVDDSTLYADAAVSVGNIFVYRTDDKSGNKDIIDITSYTDYNLLTDPYKYTTGHYMSVRVPRGISRTTGPNTLEVGDRQIVPNLIYSVSSTLQNYEESEYLENMGDENNITDISTRDTTSGIYKDIYINGIIHYDNRIKTNTEQQHFPENSIMSGDSLVIAVRLVRGEDNNREEYCHFTKPFKVHLMEIPDTPASPNGYLLSDNMDVNYICRRCGREYYIDNNSALEKRLMNIGSLTAYSESPDMVEIDSEGNKVNVHNDNTIRIIGTRVSTTIRDSYKYYNDYASSDIMNVEEYLREQIGYSSGSGNPICVECGRELDYIEESLGEGYTSDGELHLIRSIEAFNGFYGIHHPICDMLSRSEYIYADNYITTIRNMIRSIERSSMYDRSCNKFTVARSANNNDEYLMTINRVTTWYNSDGDGSGIHLGDSLGCEDGSITSDYIVLPEILDSGYQFISMDPVYCLPITSISSPGLSDIVTCVEYMHYTNYSTFSSYRDIIPIKSLNTLSGEIYRRTASYTDYQHMSYGISGYLEYIYLSLVSDRFLISGLRYSDSDSEELLPNRYY